MVKLGWMQDSHINDDGDDTDDGAHAAIPSDIDTLGGTYGVSDIYWTGDQVAPSDTSQVPHAKESYYDRFWSLVDQASYSDRVKYAIPGNHDVPIQAHLSADQRAIVRAKVEYSGVTVLLLNSHGHGYSTGSPGEVDNAPGGPGVTVPHIPYSDLQWLDQELANAGSNAVLVLTHAPMHTFDCENLTRLTTSNGRHHVVGQEVYEVCSNHHYIHEQILSNYNKVVAPASHLWQAGSDGRGSTTIDGVDYVYKNHYYDGGNGDTVNTFGYIDITSTGVTIKTIEHSDGTEYTLLNKTF